MKQIKLLSLFLLLAFISCNNSNRQKGKTVSQESETDKLQYELKDGDTDQQEFENILILNSLNGYNISDITQNEFDNNLTNASPVSFLKNSSVIVTPEGIEIICENTTVNFKNIGGDRTDKISYTYIGYSNELNREIINVRGYEHGYCILLDIKNGEMDTIANIPYISPDVKYIFCHRYNPYEEHYNIPPPTSDVHLYEIDGNSINLILKDVYTWIIEDLYWKDEVTIYLKGEEKGQEVFKKICF